MPVQAQLIEDLDLRERTLVQRYAAYLKQKRMQLEHLAQHRILQKPELIWQEAQQRLDDKAKQLEQLYGVYLQQKQQQIAKSAAQLNALSPLSVLSRGYAVCHDQNGGLVRSADQVQIGDSIAVILEHGTLKGTITGREEHAWKQ